MGTLYDQKNLAAQPEFQARVAAAAVHSAINIISEVTGDVQTISMGAVTSGTFTLNFLGQTTSALQWNSSAVAVQTALQALSTIGSGNVECTGGPLPSTPVVVNFIGTLVGAQPSLGHTDTLSGGTASIAHTTLGTWVLNHLKRAALSSLILASPSSYGERMALGVADADSVQVDFPGSNYSPATVTQTVQNGTLSSGSATVTSLPSTASLLKNQPVSGTGIQNNTIISSITSLTQIVLSATATASGSQSLTFAAFRQTEAQITADMQLQMDSIIGSYM